MAWSYESSQCNVLVDENLEISAAKSTIAETNKSSQNRPKSATSTISSQSSSSSSAATSSSTSSSTSAGGNFSEYKKIRYILLKNQKRYRRNILNSNNIDGSSDVTFAHNENPLTIPANAIANSHDLNLHETDTSTTQSESSSSFSPSSFSSSSYSTYSFESSSSSSLSLPKIYNLATTINSNNEKTNADGNIWYGMVNENDEDDENPKNGNNEYLMTTNTIVDNSMFGELNSDLTVKDNEILSSYATNGNEENLMVTNDISVTDNSHFDTFTTSTPANLKNDDVSIEVIDNAEISPNQIEQNLLDNNQQNDMTANLVNDDDIQFISLDQPHYIHNMIDSDSDIDIHPLDDKTNVTDQSHWNSADGYPYIHAFPDEKTRYEVHDSNTQSQNTNTHDTQQQRILVNVSIATDNGSGTKNHAVYMLHVSVPADFRSNGNTDDSSDKSSSTSEPVCPPEPPPAPPCPCKCNSMDILIDEALNVTATNDSSTTDAPFISTEAPDFNSQTDVSTDPTEIISTTNSSFGTCLERQDIPTILILEGERRLTEIVHDDYSLKKCCNIF